MSSYSAWLHPNEDPSEISQFNGGLTPSPHRNGGGGAGASSRRLGRFKGMVAWIDEHWLTPLLVNKSQDQIKAADDVEEMI